MKYEGRYPSGPNGERLPSYQVAVGCEVHGDAVAVQEALDDLRNFMTPAPIRSIEAWLAELSVLTAGRGREGLDAELLVSAYTGRLSQYPADVARHVLLGKSWKWFPSWDELEKLCEAMASPRRHMIAALERGPVEPEKPRQEPTQEERDRIDALVKEMFPKASKEWREAAAHEAAKPDYLRR